MTWFADEIILRATPKAISTIAASAQLAPFASWVRSLENHPWHTPEVRHGLPPEGLLVIQPVCGKSSHGFRWYDQEVLDWDSVMPPGGTADLDVRVSEALATYLDGDLQPPQTFRKALMSIATTTNQAVIYYSCGMWGGSIDYEYCLAYEPAESLLRSQSELSDERTGDDDTLREGLAKVGLDLPMGHFALHERAFPWAEHRFVT